VLSLAALPLTPNGKVDRKALPMPDLEARLSQTYEEPVTEFERILAAIWAEVLGQPRVGRLENFFELGGDSINTLQVLARAHQRGLKLTPKQLFEHPTVAAAAAVAIPTGMTSEEDIQAQETESNGLVGIELSDEDMSNLLEELK
jgi:aryl carrier-like protein